MIYPKIEIKGDLSNDERSNQGSQKMRETNIDSQKLDSLGTLATAILLHFITKLA